jgi:hypothetical protein
VNFSPQVAHLQVRESSAVGALDCEVAAVEVEEAGVVPSFEVELSPPDGTVLLSGAADMFPSSFQGLIARFGYRRR